MSSISSFHFVPWSEDFNENHFSNIWSSSLEERTPKIAPSKSFFLAQPSCWASLQKAVFTAPLRFRLEKTTKPRAPRTLQLKRHEKGSTALLQHCFLHTFLLAISLSKMLISLFLFELGLHLGLGLRKPKGWEPRDTTGTKGMTSGALPYPDTFPSTPFCWAPASAKDGF